MSTVGSGHHLTRTVTFDFAGRITCRALHIIAFVGDIAAVKLDCGWLGDYRSARGGLVTVKDQITLHGLARKTSVTIMPVSC